MKLSGNLVRYVFYPTIDTVISNIETQLEYTKLLEDDNMPKIVEYRIKVKEGMLNETD